MKNTAFSKILELLLQKEPQIEISKENAFGIIYLTSRNTTMYVKYNLLYLKIEKIYYRLILLNEAGVAGAVAGVTSVQNPTTPFPFLQFSPLSCPDGWGVNSGVP